MYKIGKKQKKKQETAKLLEEVLSKKSKQQENEEKKKEIQKKLHSLGRGEVKNYRETLQQYKQARGSAHSTDDL